MYEEKSLYEDYLKTKKIHEEVGGASLPEEWSWGWQRWCIENCNNVGQCGWVRENCPFTDFKLSLFTNNDEKSIEHV